MKRLFLILAFTTMVACRATPTGVPEATYKAVYLVQENGQLSKEDLQAHPEVIATSSFDEFKQRATNKTALWIDINSVGLVDKDWLNQKPQRFYPIALVGLSNALCAFRDTLGGFGIIEGPPADCSSLPPGFSVWMLEEETSSGASASMEGYKQMPTAQDILDKTNPLLSKQ